MGNKLKPCPFCGGRNLDLEVDGHYDEDNDSYEFYAFIECNDCKAYLSNKHLPDDEEEAKEEITAIWNKRTEIKKISFAGIKRHIPMKKQKRRKFFYTKVVTLKA